VFKPLLIIFLTIPVIEIYLLITVGGFIGVWPTVALVVITAVIGATLLRLQGLITLQKAQQNIARGEMPALEMLEGIVLLIAGALLLTPGFFTDTIGFLALIPPLRQRVLKTLMARAVVNPNTHFYQSGEFRQHSKTDTRTIEGDYTREE
jgi:UPF0716 protein FxsA